MTIFAKYLTKKGLVTISIHSNDQNKIDSIAYLSRNDEGKLKSVTSYDGNGKLIAKTLENYENENYQNGETAVSNETGNITSRYVVKTDEKGDVTEINYDATGKVVKQKVYVYERDTKGNWIKEEASEWTSKDERLILIKKKETRRLITYF